MSRAKTLQNQFDILVDGVVAAEPWNGCDEDDPEIHSYTPEELKALLHKTIDSAMYLNVEYMKWATKAILAKQRKEALDAGLNNG